jgi:membrane protease YdiL (CAAX protease family)
VKNSILAFIDSEPGGTIITGVALLVVCIPFILVDVFKFRISFIRRFFAILTVYLLIVLLANTLTYQIFLLFASFSKKNNWIILFIQLALFCASMLFVCLFFILCRRRQSLLFPRIFYFDRNVVVVTFLTVLPTALFLLLRTTLLGANYTNTGFQVFYRSIVVVPFVEEILFRYYLPRLYRSEDCRIADYILFSIVFQLLHLDAMNIMPFFISLYLYWVVRKSNSLFPAILIHSCFNFVYYFFPYTH